MGGGSSAMQVAFLGSSAMWVASLGFAAMFLASSAMWEAGPEAGAGAPTVRRPQRLPVAPLSDLPPPWPALDGALGWPAACGGGSPEAAARRRLPRPPDAHAGSPLLDARSPARARLPPPPPDAAAGGAGAAAAAAPAGSRTPPGGGGSGAPLRELERRLRQLEAQAQEPRGAGRLAEELSAQRASHQRLLEHTGRLAEGIAAAEARLRRAEEAAAARLARAEEPVGCRTPPRAAGRPLSEGSPSGGHAGCGTPPGEAERHPAGGSLSEWRRAGGSPSAAMPLTFAIRGIDASRLEEDGRLAEGVQAAFERAIGQASGGSVVRGSATVVPTSPSGATVRVAVCPPDGVRDAQTWAAAWLGASPGLKEQLAQEVQDLQEPAHEAASTTPSSRRHPPPSDLGQHASLAHGARRLFCLEGPSSEPPPPPWEPKPGGCGRPGSPGALRRAWPREPSDEPWEQAPAGQGRLPPPPWELAPRRLPPPPCGLPVASPARRHQGPSPRAPAPSAHEGQLAPRGPCAESAWGCPPDKAHVDHASRSSSTTASAWPRQWLEDGPWGGPAPQTFVDLSRGCSSTASAWPQRSSLEEAPRGGERPSGQPWGPRHPPAEAFGSGAAAGGPLPAGPGNGAGHAHGGLARTCQLLDSARSSAASMAGERQSLARMLDDMQNATMRLHWDRVPDAHGGAEHHAKPHTAAGPGRRAPPASCRVTVVAARGLRAADFSALGAASSDPYCVCEVPGHHDAKFQTKVIKKNTSPEWNHTARVADLTGKEDLVFTVYDWDRFSKDDLLGKVTLPASRFLPHGFDGELQLESAGQGVTAFLHVRIEVELDAGELDATGAEEKAHLEVQPSGATRGGAGREQQAESRGGEGPPAALAEGGHGHGGGPLLRRQDASDLLGAAPGPLGGAAEDGLVGADGPRRGGARLLGGPAGAGGPPGGGLGGLCAGARGAAGPAGPACFEVTVVSARGLRAADFSVFGSSSDPYVVCEVTGRPDAKFQTPVIKKSTSPEWNFTARVADLSGQEDLRFLVKDWDRVSSDDPLGHVALPAHKFFHEGFDGELLLEDAGKGITAFLRVRVVRAAKAEAQTSAEVQVQATRRNSQRSSRASSRGAAERRNSRRHSAASKRTPPPPPAEDASSPDEFTLGPPRGGGGHQSEWPAERPAEEPVPAPQLHGGGGGGPSPRAQAERLAASPLQLDGGGVPEAAAALGLSEPEQRPPKPQLGGGGGGLGALARGARAGAQVETFQAVVTEAREQGGDAPKKVGPPAAGMARALLKGLLESDVQAIRVEKARDESVARPCPAASPPIQFVRGETLPATLPFRRLDSSTTEYWRSLGLQGFFRAVRGRAGALRVLPRTCSSTPFAALVSGFCPYGDRCRDAHSPKELGPLFDWTRATVSFRACTRREGGAGARADVVMWAREAIYQAARQAAGDALREALPSLSGPERQRALEVTEQALRRAMFCHPGGQEPVAAVAVPQEAASATPQTGTPPCAAAA
ncbi:unnamed protein product [Prorocentrum cordatum]|uniref:Uncharacterized protein n=1 Tax=Prorocentrum cordatum TaxID=2364126 RepID=A0ABN9US22_9DINO|nr:unnamed protein product [Polarella glacialis]